MATLPSLTSQGALVQVRVHLGPDEGVPVRTIYALPEVSEWMANTLPKLPIDVRADRSPKEELDDLLFNFISSQGNLIYDRMIKDLMPARDECWEMKTWQLRIFGWFYKKDFYRCLCRADG